MADERRSVLGRALRILDTVKDTAGGLSLSEISRRSRVPLTTAHRIVAELQEWGALERGGSGKYQIGLRLWEVAAVTPRSVGLQRVALPFMQDLFETMRHGARDLARPGRPAGPDAPVPATRRAAPPRTPDRTNRHKADER